jgi:hypothetical protein
MTEHFTSHGIHPALHPGVSRNTACSKRLNPHVLASFLTQSGRERNKTGKFWG